MKKTYIAILTAAAGLCSCIEMMDSASQADVVNPLNVSFKVKAVTGFVDADGKVVGREQGLQEKYFGMLTPGKSTEADVWALWGKCAQKYEFNLVNEHAWMYRYKAPGGFDMAVWPQFGADGVLRSLETTLDPWTINDSSDFE